MKLQICKTKSRSMKKISKASTNKMSLKNKSKSIKKNTSPNGKKEYKSPLNLILKLFKKSISMIENPKLMKFSNGLLWLFMDNLNLNFIGQTLNNKSSIKMMDRISDKEWEKSMPALPENNKKLKLLISSLIGIKLFFVKS